MSMAETAAFDNLEKLTTFRKPPALLGRIHQALPFPHAGINIHKAYVHIKSKTRHVVASYNADISGLFTEKGRAYLAELKLSEADRFAVDMLLSELDQHGERLKEANKKLQAFGRQASVAEREARSVLDSIPCVGPVTIDAVLAEVGDIRRFSSQRKATAYAGLAPGIRESAGRGRQLGITKEGAQGEPYFTEGDQTTCDCSWESHDRLENDPDPCHVCGRFGVRLTLG